MSRRTLRITLTILMYLGVSMFIFAYASGKVAIAAIFILGGAALAVVCGLCRCYFTEGDCPDRIPADELPTTQQR